MDITVAMILVAIETAFNSRAERYRVNAEQHGEPTRDRNGRYHAPHDGFVWIDEQVYAGGEYLPDTEYNMGGSTIRYFTTTEVAESLRERALQYGISVGTGKSWGEGDCYAYVEGPDYIIKTLPRLGDRVIVEDGTFPTGKVWKFSFKRWINANPYELDIMTDAEYNRLKTLDKKMVGYYRPRLVK